MALPRIAKFDWEKILSKIESPDVKRSINLLRGKSNEITTNAGKFVKPAELIDFKGYKSKLKFTASSVDALEKIYTSTRLPQYTATLSSLESHRRAALMEVVKSTVSAANNELELLNNQMMASQSSKFTRDTSAGQTMERFPTIGREVEQELKTHQWLKDT